MTDSLHETLEKISKSATALAQTDDVELAERFACIAEFAVPPSNNMGVPYPDTSLNFSHREKSSLYVSKKTSIDWLGYSSPHPIEAVVIGLQVIWPDLNISTSKAGMRGYPECKAIYVDEIQYGLIGYGAKHGRLSVSLTGVACKTLKTDDQFNIVSEMLSIVDARLTRVDLCFDFYKGEVTFDYALHAFERGDFKAPKANKNPEHSVISSKGGDGQNRGRTLYIGPRNGEKFGRVYEKGLEVFAKMPEEYRLASTERESEIRGTEPVRTIADDWVRLEVEFKRVNKDRPIPLDIVTNRDEYFAGAFPFYAHALQMGDGKGRSRIKSDSQMSHDKLIMAHRQAYGNHVHTLRRIGFTDKEIADMLDTGRHNQRLLKTGLVAVEQQAVRQYRADGDDSDIPF